MHPVFVTGTYLTIDGCGFSKFPDVITFLLAGKGQVAIRHFNHIDLIFLQKIYEGGHLLPDCKRLE